MSGVPSPMAAAAPRRVSWRALFSLSLAACAAAHPTSRIIPWREAPVGAIAARPGADATTGAISVSVTVEEPRPPRPRSLPAECRWVTELSTVLVTLHPLPAGQPRGREVTGQAWFDSLPPGRYTLRVHALEFAPATSEVTIRAGGADTVLAVLRPTGLCVVATGRG